MEEAEINNANARSNHARFEKERKSSKQEFYEQLHLTRLFLGFSFQKAQRLAATCI
jgi:hypothetical protein